jgi:hypothetical protein
MSRKRFPFLPEVKMPYIKEDRRPQFESAIADILTKVESVGDLNYVLSSIIWAIFDSDRNYKTANGLIGVLECAKVEFYRRQVSVLENEKQMENGDII